MSAKCHLEAIRRIHLLRDELESSLRATAVVNGSSPPHHNDKRHLDILFRSNEVAQIQISGKNNTTVTGLNHANHARHVPPPSRFTVSPIPNAMPATTEDCARWCNNNNDGLTKPRPLHVMITAKHGEMDHPKGGDCNEGTKSISLSPSPLISASSPASSIDSGVASPGPSPGGANDFPFNNGPSSPTFPSWATIPRTKRRVFNFISTSSMVPGTLIDALALPSPGKFDGVSMDKMFKNMTLQNAEYGSRKNESLSQPKNTKNGYFSTSSSTLAQTPAAPAPIMQRQLSAGSAPFEEANAMHGLPPRAATMPPLKSILKKPKIVDNGAQTTTTTEPPLPRNHQRRMPTRIILSRSVSEGLLDFPHPGINGSAASFNANIFGELRAHSNFEAFDEHLEEQQDGDEGLAVIKEDAQEQPRGISTSSSCSTETIDSDDINQPAPLTKKRVSFSEQVQARIYRSNSSILGQRRKNEKKSRQRSNRRCNSDAIEIEGEECAASCNSSEQTLKHPPSLPICRVREQPASSMFSSPPTASSGLSVLAQ